MILKLEQYTKKAEKLRSQMRLSAIADIDSTEKLLTELAKESEKENMPLTDFVRKMIVYGLTVHQGIRDYKDGHL